VSKDLDLWQFIGDRLRLDQAVMLLVVATSTGSSPGRPGYKMAVAANGDLTGSIGGGVMEMRLVEQAKSILSRPTPVEFQGFLIEQVHRKNTPNASGMICSGRQTIIFRLITPLELPTVGGIIAALSGRHALWLTISQADLAIMDALPVSEPSDLEFQMISDMEFSYNERLGKKNDLYIVGGGHCSLALSELMSRMDFNIRIFDDRPDLNTIAKNDFADEVMIIDKYENVGEYINPGDNVYIVVMTVGYASDADVIRTLVSKDYKYIGVLGSKTKMATLMKHLRDEGASPERLERLYTPIGVPINSRTPEEIAVSIAAEIIGVKNADQSE
jgi:xanthine dehydrogenase accessory factor